MRGGKRVSKGDWGGADGGEGEGGWRWRRTSEPAREWEVVNRLKGIPGNAGVRRAWPEPQGCSPGR